MNSSLSSGNVITKSFKLDFDSESDLSNNFNAWIGTAWNEELQIYTSSAAQVQNGMLNIETTYQDGKYYSARLTSKFSLRYGTIEGRMKLPSGKGIWPAFWLFADNKPENPPHDGEIDIMEMVGYEQVIKKKCFHLTYSKSIFVVTLTSIYRVN
jgi:beta-glucanase (GH16 family)